MAFGQGNQKGTLAPSLSFPSTRILGRKRVAVSPAPNPSGPYSPVRTLQKQRSTKLHMDDTTSLLESLPQDVLVKALCKVNHSDLRHLLLVSKPVREATVVARELHFEFTTPLPKAACDEDDMAWAPEQRRVARPPLRGKDLANIAINLSESFDNMASEV